MAQPSLCPAAWSHTPWQMLYNQPLNILRFTSERGPAPGCGAPQRRAQGRPWLCAHHGAMPMSRRPGWPALAAGAGAPWLAPAPTRALTSPLGPHPTPQPSTRS